MYRRARITRILDPHLDELHVNEFYEDEAYLNEIARQSRYGGIDRAAVTLHRLLTDASGIGPPVGLAERTIARIDQLRSAEPE